MPGIFDPVGAFIDYPPTPVEHAARGPLAGLTFAVKDIYDVAGYPSGWGNPTRTTETAPAREHADCVARLLDAGCRFAGKTHTVELAFGMDGINEHYGTPQNPAAPDRVPGGSSSGSVAAVGAGLVDLALGSDTGGSVRMPASFCGQIGLRTTYGRIDISGTMPLAESLDTVGWFARTPEIHERVGAVLLGEAREGPPLRRLVVASDAVANLLGAPERAAIGAALDKVRPFLAEAGEQKLSEDGLDSWAPVFLAIQGFEAWRFHKDWITAHPGALGVAVAGRFAAGAEVDVETFERAYRQRNDISARVRGILADDGVIALPTAPTVAPALTSSDEELETFRRRALALTCTAGLAGLPQISLPLAAVDGAPMGLSLIGPAGRDRALLALARQILDT
ncbi:MAG: amidase [Alphaproteobacteria bacterium]